MEALIPIIGGAAGLFSAVVVISAIVDNHREYVRRRQAAVKPLPQPAASTSNADDRRPIALLYGALGGLLTWTILTLIRVWAS